MATPRKIGLGSVGANTITRDMLATDLQAGVAAGLQEGVLSGCKAATNGSGLQVAIPVGACLVMDDTTGLLIPFRVPASVVTPGAADASNPRIDQICLTTGGNLVVVAGTATSGATLANRTGATALPANYLRLADVLIPATFTGPLVTATHIRDRRPWARGAFWFENLIALGTINNTASFAAISNTIRLECSGAPMEIDYMATYQGDASCPAGATLTFGLAVDGADVGLYTRDRVDTTNTVQQINLHFPYTPSAGSHTFAILGIRTGSGGNLYLSPGGNEVKTFSVRENLQPVGSND